MNITTRVNAAQDELLIRVNGSFIFDWYSDFHAAYSDTRDRYETYVIDLADTQSLDSAALGMLLQLRGFVGARREAVRIINCSPQVCKLFKIARFNEIFDIPELSAGCDESSTTESRECDMVGEWGNMFSRNEAN